MRLRALSLRSFRSLSAPGALPWLMACLVALSPAVRGQDDAPPDKPQAKALKYHESLLKRPAPGYLFDRFFNTWLDTGTVAELETFLQGRVKANGDTANRLLLAYFHVRQGNTVQAIAEFRAALEKDPGNAEAWYQKGVVEARTLNFETALNDLQKASAASPKTDLALQIGQLRGKLLVRSGKTAEALEVWKGLLASRPDDEDLREDIVDAQTAEGLLDAASAAAKDLVEKTKDPQKKVLRRLRLGDLRQRAGQREEAADIYAACLADVGAGSWLEKEILGQIDKIYRGDDQMEALEKRLRKLVETEPRRLSTRVALAQLLTQNGSAAPALKAWQEVLALTPGDQAMRLAFVDAVAALSKPEEAIKQLESLLAQKPGDTVLLGKLSQLLFTRGDKPALRTTLEKLAAAEDRSDGARLRVAALYDRYGLAEEGLAFLLAAAKADPASEALQDALAAAQYKAGKKDEARALWTSMAKAAKDAPRLSAIARLASAQGEKDLAFTLLKEHAAEWPKDAVFLTELSNLALAADKAAEVLPWVRQRVAAPPAPADADRAIEEAVRVVRAAKEAGENYLDALLKSAETPRDLALLACLLEARGDARQADEALAKAAAAEPLLGHLVQVRLLSLRRQPEQAAEALAKIFRTPEGRKTVNAQRMASLLREAGRAAEALKWIAEWKSLAPGAPQPWLLESEILEDEGRAKEAVTAMRQAVQKFDKDQDLKARLARLYRAAGQPGDARRLYEQLFEDATDNAQRMRWVHELATSAEETGRVRELVESFEERRRNNRASIFPLLALAEIHHVAGDNEKRRDALLEAARLKPDDVELLLEIARVEVKQENHENALTTLRKARPLDKTGRASQLIAQTLLTLGRTEEGLRELQELTASGSAGARAVEQMAQTLLASQGPEAAARFLRPQCERFPEDYRLGTLLVFALRQSGETAEALTQTVRLWNIQAELPASGPAVTGLPNMDEESSRRYTKGEPPGMTEAFQTVRGVWYVGSRENGRGRGNSRRGGGGAAQDLPGSLFEKDTLCLGWFAQGVEDPAASAASLEKQLTTRPVPQLTTLLAMGKAMEEGARDSGNGPFIELARAHPDNDLMQDLMIYSMAGNPRATDTAMARKAWERFKDRYPKPALVAALICFQEPGAALAPVRAAALKQLETPLEDPDFLHSCFYALFNQDRDDGEPAGARESKDDPAYAADLKALRRLAVKLLSAPGNVTSSPSRSGYYMRRLATQILRQDADYPALLDLVLASDAGKTGGVSAGGFSAGAITGGGEEFEPPAFPPDSLESVPDEALQLSHSLKEDFEKLSGPELATRVSAWKAAVEAKVKDPVLKAVLSIPAGDDAYTAACVEAVAKLPVPTVDSCLLLAGWEAKKENWKDSAEWLRRGLFLPISRGQREALDHLLTAIVLQQPEALGDAQSPLIATAKDAALRLRLTITDRDMKSQLIEAMEALGLKEAAESESDKLTGGPSAGPRARMGAMLGGSRSGTAGIGPKVKALLESSKRDEALALLAKTAKGELAKYASYKKNSSYNYRGVSILDDDFISLVRDNQLEEALLAYSHPETGTARLGWTDYAEFVTGFNGVASPKTRAVMKEAIAKDPGASGLRCRLAFELLPESPVAADEIMKDMPAADMDEITSRVIESNLWESSAGAYRTLSFCRRLVDKYKDAPDATWLWLAAAMRYADDAFKNFKGMDGSLSTWLTAQTEGRKPDFPLESDITAYIDLHAAIVRQAAGIKELAPLAFDDLARHELSAGKPGEALLATARAMILHPVPEPRGAAGKPGPRNYVATQAVEACRASRLDDFSPVALLVAHAVETGGLEALKTEILAELEKSGRRAEARIFGAYVSLYEAPAESFLDTAREFLRAGAGGATSTRNAAESADKALLRVWRARKLKTDLGPLVLASVTPSGVARNQLPGLAALWAAELGKQRNRPAARAFMVSVVEKLLGPLEKRAEVVVKNHGASNDTGRCLEQLQSFFQTFAADHLMALLGAEVLQEQLSPFHPDYEPDKMNRQRLQVWLDRKDWMTCPDYLKEEIALTPFILDLPDFTPRLTRVAKPARFPLIVTRLTQTPARFRQAFTAVAPAETFGGKIIRAALNDDGLQEVIRFMGSEKERIEKLPDARQLDLRLFVEVLMKQGGDTSAFTPETRATLDWLLKLGGESLPVDPRVLAFLKQPATRAANFQPRDFVEMAGGLAAGAVTNPGGTEDVLRHAREIIQANPRRDSDEDPTLTQLGRYYFSGLAPDGDRRGWRDGEAIDMITAGLRGLLDESKGPGYLVPVDEDSFERLCSQWYQIHRAAHPTDLGGIFLSMAREAEGKLRPDEWPLLAHALAGALKDRSGFNADNFSGAISALEKRGADIPSVKPLIMVLKLGRIAESAPAKVNPDMKPGEVSSSQKWMLQTLQDKTRPLSARYTAAVGAAGILGHSMDPLLLVEVLKTFHEAVAAKRPWTSGDLGAVIECLFDAPDQEAVSTAATTLLNSVDAKRLVLKNAGRYDTDTTTSLLRVASRYAPPEAAMQMIKTAVRARLSEREALPMEWLLLCLEAGNVDTARYLMAQSKGVFDKGGNFSARLQKTLPKLLESIPSADERWALETRIVAIPDSQKDGNDRYDTARLVAFATRLRDAQGVSPAVMDDCVARVAGLFGAVETRKTLKDRIQECLKRNPLSTLYRGLRDSRHEEDSPAARMVALHGMAAMDLLREDQNYDAWLAALEEHFAAMTAIRQYPMDTVVLVLRNCHWWAISRAADRKPVDLKKVAEGMRKVLRPGCMQALINDFYFTLPLIHGVAGDMPALYEHMKALPEADRRFFLDKAERIRTGTSRNVWKNAVKGNEEVRAAGIRGMLTAPWLPLQNTNGYRLPELVAANWATNADVAVLAEDLLARYPANANLAGEIVCCVDATDNPELMFKCLARYRKITTPEDELRWRLFYTGPEVMAMLRQGRVDEARAIMDREQPVLEQEAATVSEGYIAPSVFGAWLSSQGRLQFLRGEKEKAVNSLALGLRMLLVAREAGFAISNKAKIDTTISWLVEARSGQKLTRMTLLPEKSVWSYLDGTALAPAGWQAADFAAAGWKSGPAPLGYGDPVATEISFGPDKKKKPLTAWFRTEFNVDDPAALPALQLSACVDDGACFYLNGKEIWRHNLPSGELKPETKAKTGAEDADESAWHQHALPADGFLKGRNVLAVEVHQANATSSDLMLKATISNEGALADPAELLKGFDARAAATQTGILMRFLTPRFRPAIIGQ